MSQAGFSVSSFGAEVDSRFTIDGESVPATAKASGSILGGTLPVRLCHLSGCPIVFSRFGAVAAGRHGGRLGAYHSSLRRLVSYCTPVCWSQVNRRGSSFMASALLTRLPDRQEAQLVAGMAPGASG
ncbi:hypothetical protein [Sphingomonas sp. NFX23]|jgi:hypothetical protein|uniref:hypothetical protein n=1 Tax=Sphingomonas sp. NFX23 TaxID=2819532 RepID=UPI003CF82B19